MKEQEINVVVYREFLHCTIFCASKTAHPTSLKRPILDAYLWQSRLIGGGVTSLELTDSKWTTAPYPNFDLVDNVSLHMYYLSRFTFITKEAGR